MLKKMYPVILIFYCLSCGPSIKTTGTAVTTLSTHKIIAIIPFEVFFASKLEHAKEFTTADMEQLKKYMSFSLQRHLLELFQKKEKRFPHTVAFQSFAVTNRILSEKNIVFKDFFSLPKKDICKILQVDAIVFTRTVFGKKAPGTENQKMYHGDLETAVGIYDSLNTAALWTFTDSRGQESVTGWLTNPGQTALDKNHANDKYEEVMLTWYRTIEAVFQNLTADFPYKK